MVSARAVFGLIRTTAAVVLVAWNVGCVPRIGPSFSRIGPDCRSSDRYLRATVGSLAFSPDGSRIAASTFDGSVYVWELASGEITAQFVEPDAASMEWPTDAPLRWVAVAPNGEDVLTATGKSVKCRASGTGTCRYEVPDLALRKTVALSADGRRLLTDGEGALVVRDAATGEVVRSIEGIARPPGCVALSPDGRSIVGANWDDVRVWDVETGRERLALSRKGVVPIRRVAWLRDTDRFVTASVTGITSGMTVWDGSTGEKVVWHEVKAGSGFGTCELSADGSLVVFTDREAVLYDVESGREVQRFSPPGDFFLRPAISRDKQSVATAGGLTIRVWDVATGREQQCLRVPYEGEGPGADGGGQGR